MPLADLLINHLAISWEINWIGFQGHQGQGKGLGSAADGFIIFNFLHTLFVMFLIDRGTKKDTL